MQGITIMEPVMSKAARQLGIDQVAIRRVNAPVGKAPFGPAYGTFRPTCTSSFLVEALDRGVELFDWETRRARSGRRNGSKVRGAGVSVSTFVSGSTGFDGPSSSSPTARCTSNPAWGISARNPSSTSTGWPPR
jgi:xanthine dehydrogenase molybdenum-binding subunit